MSLDFGFDGIVPGQEPSAARKAQPWFKVCICGHPVSRHELVGTDYARCRLYSTTPCNCAEKARAVLEVEPGHTRSFQRKARGKERPHALDAGLAKAVERGAKFSWLTLTCDSCGHNVEGQETYALDDAGRPQGAWTPGVVGVDSGRHARLCPGCVDLLR